MSRTNVVAVSGDVDQAGAIVYWTLSGAVAHAELAEAWLAAGFDDAVLPDPPNPQTACLRAVNEYRSERGRTLRRPLEGYRGHALVKETADDRDLDWDIKCRAEVDAVGRIKVDIDTTGCGTEEAEELEAIKAGIEAAYDRHLFNELSTSDVSGWLVKHCLAKVDAVGLRPTGGFYFVPRANLAQWDEIVEVLRSVSNHGFFSIPAMHTDDAVDAVLSAVTHEAKSMAEAMWDDIAKGELGGRGLEKRAADADAMKEKVERYERLLGLALPDLQDSLTKLRANLGAAAIKANADQDYSELADLCDL